MFTLVLCMCSSHHIDTSRTHLENMPRTLHFSLGRGTPGGGGTYNNRHFYLLLFTRGVTASHCQTTVPYYLSRSWGRGRLARIQLMVARTKNEKFSPTVCGWGRRREGEKEGEKERGRKRGKALWKVCSFFGWTRAPSVSQTRFLQFGHDFWEKIDWSHSWRIASRLHRRKFSVEIQL